MAEPCELCRLNSERIIDLKQGFEQHKEHTAKRFEKHSHEITALQKVTNNTGASITAIEESIRSFKEWFARQEKWQQDHEKWQQDHEKSEIQKIEEVKSELRAGIKSILDVVDPVEKETQKNTRIIQRMIWGSAGVAGLAYCIWWLYEKGFIVIMLGGD